MTTGYTKDDVKMHREGYGFTRTPAINVKFYGHIDPELVADRLGCSLPRAETCLQYAGETLAEMAEDFWDDIARDIFGDESLKVKVYSEGRSGGWLIVKGLPDIEYWDAIMLGKWRSLEVTLHNAIKVPDFDYVIDLIETNEWHVEPEEEGCCK